MAHMIDYTPHPACLQVAREVQAAGGCAFIVGGWVRDALLGLQPKDVDMEVFGLETEQLEALLSRAFRIDRVGRSFAVFKLKGLPIDVSLPRRESKSGTGHKGFEVVGDPHLRIIDAARRRDFTLNALLWDPLEGELHDPFSGRRDLEAGILRHVSEKFSEDPLRVLRGMQFIARFELRPAEETLELCRKIEPESLPRERIFEEWRKLLLQGRRPSLGLEFLRSTDWLRYFPELAALVGCEQDPQWHPEGDVWTHTGHCLDVFARQRTGEAREDLIVGLAVLCHDFGKPATSYLDDAGRIRSPKHEYVGLKPAETFLRRLTDERSIIEEVLPLVETHMRPNALYKTKAGDAAIRRLARQVQRLDRLLRVVEADMGGRPPLTAASPSVDWLRERAAALSVQDRAPKPILQGRHLLKTGIAPGPHMGEILHAAYEAQLDGAFDDLAAAEAWLARNLLPKSPEK